MAHLAENSTLAVQLRAMARQRAIPHALILSGSGDRLSAARFTAAAMLCSAEDGRPCLQCTQCRKVLNDIHPDVLITEDDQRKELPVDTIRQLRTELYIRPNDGERKIAVFPRVRQLNEKNQNVLLKIVEEGPPYAAFIFCAENAGALLPTIRSRCVELKVPRQTEENQPDMSLINAFAAGKPGAVTQQMVSMELSKISREDLQAKLRTLWMVCVEALALHAGRENGEQTLQQGAALLCQNLSSRQLIALAELARHYASELDYNVGVGHILGAIAAEWEKTK